MIGGRGCVEVAKIPRTPKWESQKYTNLSRMNLATLWLRNSSLKVLIKNISTDKLSPLKITFPNTYCTIELEVF